MALQLLLNLPGALSIKGEFGEIQQGKQSVDFNAYIKIETVSGNKNNVTATVSFANGGQAFYRSYEFAPDLEGGNFIKQAYHYLKTLSEFANATDC